VSLQEGAQIIPVHSELDWRIAQDEGATYFQVDASDGTRFVFPWHAVVAIAVKDTE
jgi:hypothetical protein